MGAVSSASEIQHVYFHLHSTSYPISCSRAPKQISNSKARKRSHSHFIKLRSFIVIIDCVIFKAKKKSKKKTKELVELSEIKSIKIAVSKT